MAASDSTHSSALVTVWSDTVARIAQLTTVHATGLWTAVIAGLVLDAVLTVYGIRLGLTESNPVAADLIASVGVVPALLILKTAALAVGVGGWMLFSEPYRGLVPAGLAIPWLGASVANAITIGLTLA